MKRKELKKLAEKIAKYETIVQTSSDKDEIHRAEQAIMQLSGCVTSFEDMCVLDELIQDLIGSNT